MIPQSAAVPYRIDERRGVLVMLVTSRTRRRWIIPKGKIGSRVLASRSAEREAFEEAGVIGRLNKTPIGVYRQAAALNFDPPGDIEVQTYALEVLAELPVWQEMDVRERRWFTIMDAIKIVGDPEISAIL